MHLLIPPAFFVGTAFKQVSVGRVNEDAVLPHGVVELHLTLPVSFNRVVCTVMVVLVRAAWVAAVRSCEAMTAAMQRVLAYNRRHQAAAPRGY